MLGRACLCLEAALTAHQTHTHTPQSVPPALGTWMALSQASLSNGTFAVITGTVKTVTRGAGSKVTATVTLMNTYKSGALSLPPAAGEATLRLEVPCRQCPILKRGECLNPPPSSWHTCPPPPPCTVCVCVWGDVSFGHHPSCAKGSGWLSPRCPQPVQRRGRQGAVGSGGRHTGWSLQGGVTAAGAQGKPVPGSTSSAGLRGQAQGTSLASLTLGSPPRAAAPHSSFQ